MTRKKSITLIDSAIMLRNAHNYWLVGPSRTKSLKVWDSSTNCQVQRLEGSSDSKAWLLTLADLQKLMKDESRQTFSLHLHNFSFVFNLQLDLRLFITFLLSINQKLPINQRESWKPRWTSRTWEEFKECMLIVHWESDKKIVSFIKLIVTRKTKCSWIFLPSELARTQLFFFWPRERKWKSLMKIFKSKNKI